MDVEELRVQGELVDVEELCQAVEPGDQAEQLPVPQDNVGAKLDEVIALDQESLDLGLLVPILI